MILCNSERVIDLYSILGYGANWTPLNNSTKYTFVNAKIECHGNETDAGQCTRLGTWTESDFSGETDWGYKYGSRLYCVGMCFTFCYRLINNYKNSNIRLQKFMTKSS